MKTIKQVVIAYVILNVISILLIGQVTWLACLTNLLPTLMVYFLLSLYNEQPRKRKLSKFEA